MNLVVIRHVTLEATRVSRPSSRRPRLSRTSVDEEAIDDLEKRGFETDPDAYEDVPSKAYITIKETKPGYHYYYWQWREGDSWANEYIGPVTSDTDS